MLTRRSFLGLLVGAVAAKPAPAEPEVVSDWPHPALLKYLYRMPIETKPGGNWEPLTGARRGEILRLHQKPYRPMVLRNDWRPLKQVIADWPAEAFLAPPRCRSP